MFTNDFLLQVVQHAHPQQHPGVGVEGTWFQKMQTKKIKQSSRLIGIDSLVALVFEMFAVAVVNQECVRVVFTDPFHLLNIKCALGLDPLSFPASWNRDGKACTSKL